MAHGRHWRVEGAIVRHGGILGCYVGARGAHLYLRLDGPGAVDTDVAIFFQGGKLESLSTMGIGAVLAEYGPRGGRNDRGTRKPWAAVEFL